MRLRRLPAALLTATLAVSALAGCGEREERAVTVDTGEAAASDETDSSQEEEAVASATAAPQPGDEAGSKLTKDQVKAALLTVEDLPSGWTTGDPDEDETGKDDEPEDKITPPACEAIMDAFDEGPDASASITRNFEKEGGLMFMSETIATFEEEVDEDRLQEVADVLSKCPEFTSTDTEGVATKMKVKPLSMANFGDSSLAVTIEGETQGFALTMNMLFIAVGHNYIALVHGGLGGADGAELEPIAQAAMTRLAATAKG